MNLQLLPFRKPRPVFSFLSSSIIGLLSTRQLKDNMSTDATVHSSVSSRLSIKHSSHFFLTSTPLFVTRSSLPSSLLSPPPPPLLLLLLPHQCCHLRLTSLKSREEFVSKTFFFKHVFSYSSLFDFWKKNKIKARAHMN